MKESDFWGEFLARNNEYRTEIFGGHNPVFVPYLTDASDYQDKYIQNP